MTISQHGAARTVRSQSSGPATSSRSFARGLGRGLRASTDAVVDHGESGNGPLQAETGRDSERCVRIFGHLPGAPADSTAPASRGSNAPGVSPRALDHCATRAGLEVAWRSPTQRGLTDANHKKWAATMQKYLPHGRRPVVRGDALWRRCLVLPTRLLYGLLGRDPGDGGVSLAKNREPGPHQPVVGLPRESVHLTRFR